MKSKLKKIECGKRRVITIRTAVTVKQALLKAKDLLKRVGWVKHLDKEVELGTERVVGYCAQGALIEVAPRGIQRQAFRLLERIVGDDITSFNDDSETSKRDVYRLFNKGIKRA